MNLEKFKSTLLNPSTKLVQCFYTTLWVSAVFLFSFNFILSGLLSSTEMHKFFMEGLSSFTIWWTMLGIWFFLLFDYALSGGVEMRDKDNRLYYPIKVVLLSAFTIVAIVVVFIGAINQINNNILGFHDFFNSALWPYLFFVVYLGLIWWLRYVTVHENKVVNYTTESIVSNTDDDLEWTDD